MIVLQQLIKNSTLMILEYIMGIYMMTTIKLFLKAKVNVKLKMNVTKCFPSIQTTGRFWVFFNDVS